MNTDKVLEVARFCNLHNVQSVNELLSINKNLDLTVEEFSKGYVCYVNSLTYPSEKMKTEVKNFLHLYSLNKSKPLIKFRENRDSLEESMKTVITIFNTQTLLYCLQSKELFKEGDSLSFKYIKHNSTTNWNTYLVLVNELLVGYTDDYLPF